MANEAIKPNLQKQSGDNVIGFPDLISQNKENVTFSPLSMENGFQSIKSQAGASAGKPPQTPQGNVTALFGELQAASELSLDELAKQSELLKDIEQNTKKEVTSGGQTPPPSEEDIKKKLTGDEEELSKDQGNKIIKLLGDLGTKSASLITLFAAFKGAQSSVGDGPDTTAPKAVAATSAVAGLYTAKKLNDLRKNRLAKQDQDDDTKKKRDDKDKKKKTKTPDVKKKAAKATTQKVGTQVAKKGATFAAKSAARAAATAAAGPLAPIVGGLALAATVYDLGTMGLEAAGFGDEVEAFEEGATTGVTNFFGFDNDEQEAEADAAKVALNTKKFESLVEKIDASDLNNEEKMRQKAELQKALDNSGDVDWFGDADARKADRTFAQYEKKYGAVDLEEPMAPVPQSSTAIEAQTEEANEAEVAAMVPQVNVPPQMPPNVNVPPQPAPNISVSAVLPRTNMPDNSYLTGSQGRLPKLIVG